MSESTEVVGKSIASQPAKAAVDNRQSQRLMLLGIFAVMAILQFAVLGRQSLWVDEVFSLAVATGHSLEHSPAIADPARGDFVEIDHAIPAAELQRYLKHETPPESPMRVIRAVLLSDTSPPLYYLLLYGWTLVLGTSDFAIRSLSVLCSVACLPFMAGISRRTGGDKAIVPACALLALSPLGLYFFVEARMYPLLLLCLLATAWSSLVLREGERSVWRYLLWIASSAAGLLTHYFFLFPWGAMIAFLLITPGQLKRRNLIGALAIVGLILLPWYLEAARHLGQWHVTAGWLELAPTRFRQLHATRNQLLQFFAPGEAGFWRYDRWSSLTAILIFMTIAAAATWRWRLRLFSGPRLLLWLWLLVAWIIPTCIDLTRHTYLSNNARYALGALPPAYLLATIGIACFRAKIRIGVLVAIVVAWAGSIASIYQQEARAREPFRRIAQFVSAEATPSDVVVVHSIPSGVLGVARYANASLNVTSWVQQLGDRQVPDSLLALGRGHSRILYVKVHQLSEPAPEEDWLRANATTFSERRFELAEVVDFRPRLSETF